MRKFLIAVAALASLFAVATVAQGNTVTSPQGQVQTMTAAHSPNKAGRGPTCRSNSRSTAPDKQCQAPRSTR